MLETLRSACRNLLRRLSALPPFQSSTSRRLFAWLRSKMASLRSAARLLDRPPHGSAPALAAGVGDEEQDYADMLAELGAEPPPPEQGVDDLKDTTIRELSESLEGLRELGDQLARAEQEKLALAARVEELEAKAVSDAPREDAPHREDAAVARLERKLEAREGVLARTRERLTKQRAKTDDWKRKAAERWHRIGSLRKQVKELEQALEKSRDGSQPGPLPTRAGSGARRGPRAGRRSDRAS